MQAAPRASGTGVALVYFLLNDRRREGACGKTLFEVFKYLGAADIVWNRPKALPYPTENPWA